MPRSPARGSTLGAQHQDPLVELIQAGKITTAIDRRSALSEVPEALVQLALGDADQVSAAGLVRIRSRAGSPSAWRSR